jgi:hypothetical protein
LRRPELWASKWMGRCGPGRIQRGTSAQGKRGILSGMRVPKGALKLKLKLSL